MSTTLMRPGRREHRCDLPPARDLWWAKARCNDCGSYWVSYGDEWLPEGPLSAAGRMLSALWRVVTRKAT